MLRQARRAVHLESIQMDNAVLKGGEHRLGAIVHAELGEHALEVALHRVFGDRERRTECERNTSVGVFVRSFQGRVKGLNDMIQRCSP